MTNPKQNGQSRESGWDSLSIGFEDFRELLSPAQSGPILTSLEEMENTEQLSILETEFHLIRQILMLMNRFLDDLALVMSRLRHFSPEDLFELFFENARVGSTFDVLLSSPRIGSQMQMTQQFPTPEILPKRESRQTFVKLGENQSKGNLTARSSENKESLHMKTNATKPKLTSVGQMDERLSAESCDKVVRVRELKWFLEKHQVVFLEEDLVHVFRAFGSKSESVCVQHFERMLQSTIWRV